MEDFFKLSHIKAIKTSFFRFIFDDWTDETAKLFNAPCQTSLFEQRCWHLSVILLLINTNIFYVLCPYFITSLFREDLCLDAEQKMSPELSLITDSNRAHHLSSKVGSSPNDPVRDQPVTDLIHTIHSSILTNQRGLPLTPHQSKATVFESL